MGVKYKPSHTSILMAGEPKSVKEFINGKVHNSLTDEKALIKIEDGEDIELRIVATSP